MSVPTVTLPVTRQRELRAIREANEKAERPPYAWARLASEDIPWLIAEHGWSVTDEPGDRVDLRHANLTGMNLAGMQLRFARFDHAMLYQADMHDTDLFYAQFSGADLREVRAEGIHLDMARMRGVRLNGAQLARAQFKQAWLPEADLTAALLDGADLSGTHMDHADLHEASLIAARLCWAQLQDADLRAANLKGADLRSIHLERAQLDGADLRDADLQGAWCDDAAFYGTHLDGADLRGARLQRAQLGGAFLAGTRLAGIDLTDVDLTRIADREAVATTPTGDERAVRAGRTGGKSAGTPQEHAAALRAAADSLDLLAGALALPASTDRATTQRLQRRALALRRSALRAEARTSPAAFWRWFWRDAAHLIIGDGDAPARVALWAAALVMLVALVALVLPGQTDARDIGSALSLALTGLTSAGYGAFAAHATGALRVIGAVESLAGDALFAIFIAAVVRRNTR